MSGTTRRVVTLALVSTLLLAVTACGSDATSTDQSQPAQTVQSAEDLLGPDNVASGDPVKIGMMSDGATEAFDNTNELRAAKATAEYWNQKQGGIGGRPIELVTCESGGTADGATQCANQFVQQDVLAVTASQSAVLNTLWDGLHAAGVPTFFTQANGPDMEQDPQTFMVFDPNGAFFGLPVATAQAANANKIAFVVIDVPQAVSILEGDGAQLLAKTGLQYDTVKVPIGTADMTSQMQQVKASGAGVVQVIGNDAFCIAAFQGLQAVGYTGQITAISQCITDATRQALGSSLEGINVFSTLALGATGDPTWELYLAVMQTYGQDVTDVNNLTSLGGYAAVAALATALQDIDGSNITRDSVVSAIKSMPESGYPGGGGITYQCGTNVDPKIPPVCTAQWLRTQLDAQGNPTTYTVEDSSDLIG